MTRRQFLHRSIVCAVLLLGSRLALQAAIVISDAFNVADNVDIGASWDSGYGGDDPAKIVSNRVRGQNVNVETMETHSTAIANNQYAQFDIPTMSASGTQCATIMLRSTAPATQTQYQAQLCNYGTALYEVTAGAGTLIAGCNDATVWAAGQTGYAEVQGTTFIIKRDGVQVSTCTDAAHASGRVGISTFTDTNIADLEIDNFVAGDFTSSTLKNTLLMGCCQ